MNKYYKRQHQQMTIKDLTKKANEHLETKLSMSSMTKLVKKLGFRWRKTENNRKLLMERDDIRAKRIEYIRAIRKYRSEGRPIFYTDETYIHASHTKRSTWSDNTNNGLKTPISKGNMVIIVHAGNEEGFVPNAELVYNPKTKKEDYHDNMNFENYSKWVTTNLIPNLPPRSVVVIDNASYHNVLEEAIPSTKNRKADIQEWLKKNDITYDDSMLKCELHQLVKLNRERFVKLKLDGIFNAHGHDVLRLPPYHPIFNPIENIWGIVKERVAKRNVSFKLNDVIVIAKEELSAVTPTEWRNTCAHAWKAEDELFQEDVKIDIEVEPLIIHLSNVESESDIGSDYFD